MLGAGQRAPDVTFVAPGGERHGIEGKAVLAFFKSSCPVCQLTFPFLDKIAGTGRLRIVGVSQDDDALTAEFAKRFGLSMPLWRDPAAGGYRASNAFKITHVPSIFVIEDGKIVKAFDGFSKDDLQELARQAGIEQLFAPGDAVPAFKPG